MMKKRSSDESAGYDHAAIEAKWQKRWEKKGASRATENPSKKKFYALIEFPYPSGDGLHVGHIRSNTAMDIISRKRRREGYEVLYPIGWDAFGLPTENYAIKTGIQPAIVTKRNTENFRRQLKALGFSFDWSREVDTTDPNYYRWTQWIFLRFLEKGLAYKKKMTINWCPKDLIGLANEEVINGCCERCGTPVEKREKEQWMLAITKYADRLDKDLDTVDFLEKVKIQQRNWIGKSEGVDFKCTVKDLNITVEMYNSVPQSYNAETFAVIGPEHPLVGQLIAGTPQEKEVSAFIETLKRKKAENKFDVEKDMEGMFTGRYIKSFADTGRDLPIWIASYVVSDYGTGIVNGSAHDERDFAFAKKYNIPLHPVMFPNDPVEAEKVRNLEYCYARDPEAVLQEPPQFKGRKWAESRADIISYLAKQGFATPRTNYKLRDWIFSRQRYWGEPIPVVHCPSCAVDKHANEEKLTLSFYFKDIWERILSGAKTVETRALNPEETERYFGNVGPGDIVRFQFKDKKNNVKDERLVRITSQKIFRSFAELFEDKATLSKLAGTYADAEELKKSYAFTPEYISKIERNGLIAWDFEVLTEVVPIPEKQLPVTLPKVKNYAPTQTGESPLAAIDSWVNVKCPVCKGPAKRETDTMPNWAGSSWYYLRYTDPKNKKMFAAPDKLKYWTPVDWYNGGMEHTTLHLLYSRFWHKFLFDLGLVPTAEPYMKRTSHGLILAAGGEKMSKSKGNVVNPDSIVAVVGADALRVYEMFMGPFDQPIAWGPENIAGSRRFLERVWKLQGKLSPDAPSQKKIIHKTIKKVSDDIENMRFNTAVSALMIALNELEAGEKVATDDYRSIVQLLAPFAPHIAEEAWEIAGGAGSVHDSPWPAYDATMIAEDELTIVVQVNGKMRGSFRTGTATSRDELARLAAEVPEVKKWLGSSPPQKTIVVPGKLVNFVAPVPSN